MNFRKELEKEIFEKRGKKNEKIIIRKPIVNYIKNQLKGNQIENRVYDFLIEKAIETIDKYINKGKINITNENKLRRLNHLPEIKRICKYHIERDA
jgi:hypothetical protein